MSANEETTSVNGVDANEHLPTYIFTPSTDNATERPPKRRRVGRHSSSHGHPASKSKFEPLFNGLESVQCVEIRENAFKHCWTAVETKIQLVLEKANQETLENVTSFIQRTVATKGTSTIPTGFIATGPNIASQNLLFEQLSDRLRTEINGPVVILRSGDTSNLKAALKQVIRDATDQRTKEDDEGISYENEGRKLLNYDLEILHNYIKAHGCHKAVIAFQDSEAFDPALLADTITLFNSWMDRIPLVLLFGIATSVDLFSERLSRTASRCLYGVQFDVEQASSVLEIVFQKVVASSQAVIRLGPNLVASLMERQHDHVQSVEAFTTALKYAYMCHFYANPLAVLCDTTMTTTDIVEVLQREHFQAIRVLPSFRTLVERLLDEGDAVRARQLLEDDQALVSEVKSSLEARDTRVVKTTRQLCLLSAAAVEAVGMIDLYLKAMKGTLNDSDALRSIYDNVKRMSPESLLSFITKIEHVIKIGNPETDLNASPDEESELLEELMKVQSRAKSLVEKSAETGIAVRSSYAAHNKAVRATVVAQKVQLSYEKSTLSAQDLEFTTLVDHMLEFLKGHFTFDNPQDMFLSEVWLYDSILPYKEVFTPRPRFATERALVDPQDYLPNCEAEHDSLSSTKPPTANLYQMYLESGSLINVSDLWTAFLSMVGGDDGEGCDERTALMLFYRGLADLKLLGMVKQSKKKVDHLAKSAWSGL